MKRKLLIPVAVLLLISLLLTACGQGSVLPVDTGEETVSVTAEEKRVGVTVLEPFDRSELDALPTVTSYMSEEELRRIVVEYYRMQGTIPWTPDKDTHFFITATDKDNRVSADSVYCGLPYTSAGTSLYTFLDYYDGETGIFSNPYGSNMGSVFGDNCSTSVYWAWARVSSRITFHATTTMTRLRGAVKVGDYVLDESKEAFDKNYNTGHVCAENGLEVMSAAYACLKPGDGLVVYDNNVEPLRHHAMMATQVDITYKASGEIDPDASTVALYQQDNRMDPTVLESGQEAFAIAPMSKVYSFRKLFVAHYIPVTCPELALQAPVEKASAAVQAENGATLTPDELKNETLITNYCLSKVTLTLTDGAGETVKENFAYGKVDTYTYPFSSLVGPMTRELAPGTYKLTITALVGNGETLTAFEGTLKV